MMTETKYADSIELPTDQIFCNLKNAKWFAMDIGGALAKLAYYSTVTRRRPRIIEASKVSDDVIYRVSEEDEICDHLHFIKFETKYIDTCVNFIQQNLIGGGEQSTSGKVIKVTGGGAHKYKDLLSSKLGVLVDKEDEMECLIKGCNFLLRNIPDEAFRFQRHGNPEYVFETTNTEHTFPYLLVNIGSGVSILKVESETQYSRIGGTSIGGGTFWGLGSALTQARGFDDLLKLAEEGDHRNVDMLVKDIYGGAYSMLGLPHDLIASSFGKAAYSARDRNAPAFRNADIAKSLLIAISNDIGQIAFLNAQLHSLKKIYFGGYFIRGHPITMHTITFAVNYWSKGEIQPMFLRHEGYLGAIGAFLKGAEEEDAEKYSWKADGSSWGENYACSSGLHSPKVTEAKWSSTDVACPFTRLELDRFAKPLVTCPVLLDAKTYFPDTVDLTRDDEARSYWLQCFEDATDKLVERAVRSQASMADAEARAARFRTKYLSRLAELRKYPCAFGSLTVRNLLDTREQCLEEFHFADPFSQQKQQENEEALRQLSARLRCLDAMPANERQLALLLGVLTGNVFDWGAHKVADLMEDRTQAFGFEQALEKVEQRPWLIDDFDEWQARVSGPPHRCAVIFVDNSGVDIILGVFPFARDLINRGTQVILCANSRPALNDVTYHELTVLSKQVAQFCPKIAAALSQGRLLIMESGQGSPCLDLRYIDYDLGEAMRRHGADLIVLEGMGRAVHTNLDAKFACDSLKLAVLKNEWLARRLGGSMFSVMCKFERARRVIASDNYK